MSPGHPPVERNAPGSNPTAGSHPTEVLPRAGADVPTTGSDLPTVTGVSAASDSPTVTGLSVAAEHPTVSGSPTELGSTASGLPTAAEWECLEQGVVQRVRMFEALLADVYGGTEDARVLTDGVLPRRLVTTSERFRREAVGIAQPVRVAVASVDVVRDERGTFRVVADDLCCPAWPAHVAPHLLRALRTVAQTAARVADPAVTQTIERIPDRVSDPVVVALTPSDSALARQPGVAAVAGRDLVCWDNVVYHHDRRVDVLYRTVADDLIDPLHFQPDSVHGVSGVLNAARTGAVVLANAVGNGLGEDPLIHSFTPRLIEYYLGENPILPTVDPESFHTTQFLPIASNEQVFPHLSTDSSTVDTSSSSGLRLFAVNDGVDVTVLSDGVWTSDLSTRNVPQQNSTVDTKVLW